MAKLLKHVCIWGTSVKKVGDEAQLASILSYLKEYNPGIEVTVFSQLEEAVCVLMRQIGIKADATGLSSLSKVFSVLRRTDALLIIGGPFYEDRKQMASVCLLLAMAAVTRTPAMTFATTLFGISSSSGKAFYRWAYNRLELISSRDDGAQKVLDQLDVPKPLYPLTDPRYMLAAAAAERIRDILRAEGLNPGKPYIAITTRYLHDDMPEWVKRQNGYTSELGRQFYCNLAQFLASVADRYQLVIIPMHPTLAEDQAAAQLLFADTGSAGIMLQQRYSPFEIIGLIRDSACSIQSRLGSTVFSVLAGSPFLAISYESRMQDWMTANGLGRYCTDWRNVDAKVLQTQFDALLAERGAIRKKFNLLTRESKQRFVQQADILLSLLHGRGGAATAAAIPDPHTD